MFQLLFVSLVAFVATGCVQLKQYGIVKGWEGPSMEDMAPDRKLGRSQLPPTVVPRSSYVFDSGSGYRYEHRQGTDTSVTRSWDPWSGPRFDVNRNTYDNTHESYTLRPIYPQTVDVYPERYPNAPAVGVPLRPFITQPK